MTLFVQHFLRFTPFMPSGIINGHIASNGNIDIDIGVLFISLINAKQTIVFINVRLMSQVAEKDVVGAFWSGHKSG
ncbi:hypothetical protein ACLKA6_000306 [Drosophila palustris]